MNPNTTSQPSTDTDPMRARQIFMRVFAIALLLKIWLAAYFPLTGDEAFFYQWGIFPAWGYSDHPPMIGWLLFVLNGISAHPLSLRFLTVLLWGCIALGLIDLLRRIAPAREDIAYRLGTLFLLLPFTLLLNIVTTDTPLIFFVFLSGYCFIRGTLSGKRRWYAATGIFLGLALLSKYLAGLLAIAYFVYLFRSRRDWMNLLIIALCSMPFAAVNVVFNADHCWANVMFNLVNRNEDAQGSFKTVAEYIATLIYLVTPWIFIKLLRASRSMVQRGAMVVLFVVPFALFLLLSMEKTIGLHWVLGFMPFVFLFVGTVSSAEELHAYAKWTAWFSAPHFAVLAAIIVLPLSVWQGFALHDTIVFHKETNAIVAALRHDLPQDGIIMGRSYTPASVLSYHAGEYWPIFGTGKFHARQDDILVDFRQYAGKSIRIFDRRQIDPGELAPYFSSVTIATIEVEGARFWYADGMDFNYPIYRERILKTIADRYYRIPSFLPVYGCPFLQRYDLKRS